MPRLLALALFLALPPAAAQVGGPAPTAGARAPGAFVGVSVGTSGRPLEGSVDEVAVGPDGTVYALGWSGLAHRSDGAWAPIEGSPIEDLYALAVGTGGAVYIGGGGPASWPGGSGGPPVARWVGGTWEALGVPADGTALALATGSDGTAYAALVSGSYPNKTSRVARWSGTAWETLGGTFDGTVSALTLGPDGALYAGGAFTTVDGTAASRVARWTGTAWEDLGAGFDDTVSALALSGGAVYAAGNFEQVGDADVRYVARWAGTAWEPLGAGVDGDVEALAVDATGDLLVAGRFTHAGDVYSPSVVAYRAAPPVAAEPPRPPGVPALSVGPNPTAGPATAWVTATGPATVEVLDVLGRRLAVALDGVVAGRTAVALPSGLAPGVYVVRVRTAAGAASARLTVTR
jgi:hypothetical protein